LMLQKSGVHLKDPHDLPGLLLIHPNGGCFPWDFWLPSTAGSSFFSCCHCQGKVAGLSLQHLDDFWI